MSDNSMSRRKFLLGTGAVLGIAAIPTVVGPALTANAAPTGLPWAYKAGGLDAVACARRAYEVYYQKGCAEATWYPIVEALAVDDASTWGTIPFGMFAYGGGGIGGWGTICGTVNGSVAVAKMLGAPTGIVDTIMNYYSTTPLPTNATEKDAAAGAWIPAKTPMVNAPTSISNSPLCHSSISQWCLMSGFADGSTEQKDRCAKACYDMTFLTVTLLNEWKAGGTIIAPPLPATVTGCKSCHTENSKGSMTCSPCHDQTVDHASAK